MAMNKDFGAFELKEKIGSGGMASVYLAVQKSLQRPVVVKILYPHLAEDEKLVARFEREARAAAMMRHENIIQVIDCGRHEDVAYICMEFVEGSDLKKWLEVHGTPPIEMALLMLRDLCRGLEHAHGHRIIHRDIKPANVMLTPDGTIKIMDFGLARSGTDASSQMTMVGSVMGTPAYMSPEQATGEVVDERSDIFSAGVVAYELLGGQRPFAGDSYSSVLRAVLTQEPRELTEFNPLVPDDVSHVVRGMLQKDLTKRYAAIGQVRQELETIIEQLGLTRGKDLLREYALEPKGVADMWRKKRLSRHMDQGVFFENMGLGKIDDALREFRRVLYLDPNNGPAKEHVKKLERERQKVTDSLPPTPAPVPGSPTPAADMHTVVMEGAGRAERREPKAGAVGAGESVAPARPRRRGVPWPVLVGGVVVVAAVVIGASMFAARRNAGAPPAAPDDTATAQSAGSAGMTPGLPSAPGSQATPGGALVAGADSAAAHAGVIPTFEAATAQFDSSRFVEAAATLRALVATGTLKGAPLRAAQELRARALVRAGRPAGARRIYAELLAADPSYAPDPTGLGPGDQGAFDAARSALAPADSAAAAPAVNGPAATVTVAVSPFAAVLVDGEAKGQDQKSYKLSIKPGRHVIRAVHPTLGFQEWTVDLEPGSKHELKHDFLATASGSISISSEGGWAEIYIDGDPVHHATPWVITNVLPGKHEISLVREGFSVDGGAKTVTVRAGQQVNVTFKLKKRK